MLNPFGFAPHSLRSGTSHPKLREASRSSTRKVLLDVNVFFHCVSQNDIIIFYNKR